MTRRPIDYLPEELAWIEAHKDWSRATLHKGFCARFGRQDVTQEHIGALCKRKGWKRSEGWRQDRKGTSRVFTADQIAWMIDNHHLARRDLGPAFRTAFDGSTITDQQLLSWRKNQGVTTGRTGHFVKGQPSHNKGRKGFAPPGSEKGWFKKGERRGVAAKLYQPIGTERLSKEGYLQRKVNDDLPLQRRWRMVHVLNWEAANGPVPADHALKCLDGNRLNVAASNWEAIPRAMLPRLNNSHGRHYDTAPAEVKPALMALAKLETATAQARKQRKPGHV